MELTEDTLRKQLKLHEEVNKWWSKLTLAQKLGIKETHSKLVTTGAVNAMDGMLVDALKKLPTRKKEKEMVVPHPPSEPMEAGTERWPFKG